MVLRVLPGHLAFLGTLEQLVPRGAVGTKGRRCVSLGVKSETKMAVLLNDREPLEQWEIQEK